MDLMLAFNLTTLLVVAPADTTALVNKEPTTCYWQPVAAQPAQPGQAAPASSKYVCVTRKQADSAVAEAFFAKIHAENQGK